MSRNSVRSLVASLVVLSTLSVAAAALGQTSIDQVLDSLNAVHEFSEVAISPDGKQAAWVESQHGPNGEPSSSSAISVADLSRPNIKPRRVTAGDGSEAYAEHNIAWSPDSRQLAFLSDKGDAGQLQLYVEDVPEGAARRLTNLRGFLDAPAWSPDGKTLAFLFIENAPRRAGPLAPMTPPSGEIESHIYEQRLTTVDVASGTVRQLSPADLYVYEYEWSPDGQRFVATGAHGAGDANWWVAQLYTIDGASGEIQEILKPSFQIAEPRWSPDGKRIAFIGGLMSDEGSTGGDIYMIPAAGGEVRDLTPKIPASPNSLTWLSESRILFAEDVDGASGLATVDTAAGKIQTLWKGAETLSAGGWRGGVSLARDGRTCAVIVQSFSQPPEVWAGPIGEWRQLTRVNRDAHRNWGKSESIHWSNDGFRLQGWLTYPVDYDPSRKYPLVVQVHGGPASMAHPAWPRPFLDFTILSGQGYFVLRPNPRGSFGTGEAFTRANVKDFGYGDFRDILAGVEKVVQTLPVDPRRVGIGGWSYGGYMSMWAVTQTDRFAAAVAGAGIANWQSYYGENDIDQWMIPYFGASVYDDPAVYARSSPINFIKKAKTPTLILVGDRDGECPAPQSFEFWHALKTLGVPARLVVYPDEGHNIGQPEHRRDIVRRVMEWYGQYLK